MITICIPIYNFDITKLLNQLSKQAENLTVAVEIILIDDASNQEFKKKNEKECKKHNYIELEENVGRSKIRNLFLKYAKFDNLLFLDCDSLIVSENFISNYLEEIKKENYEIIYGGRIYDKTKPKRNKMLRWKYGILREGQSAETRNIQPNKSFMTNNFLIKKEIFEEIKFDERLTKYGHEDTLFGFELKKKNINIQHIENLILDDDIENNAEFLHKTELGLINLIHILKYLEYNSDFIEDVRILNFYKRMKNNKLSCLFYYLFLVFKPVLKLLLTKGYVNLSLFDLYKFGILIQNYKRLLKVKEYNLKEIY